MADAPVPNEVEITPEMIEAGIEAYVLFNPLEDPGEWIVCAIYEEMEKKKRA
jgi:hypothetical protein